MKWCPDCKGAGVIFWMDSTPDLDEHEEDCQTCGGKGVVPV
jgi:DnaJ-class molecular chaperone